MQSYNLTISLPMAKILNLKAIVLNGPMVHIQFELDLYGESPAQILPVVPDTVVPLVQQFAFA